MTINMSSGVTIGMSTGITIPKLIFFGAICDHDFEYEEEDSTTLQDLKEGLNVLDKGIDVWNKLTRPSKIDPSELTSNRFKVPPPIAKVRDLEIAEHPDVKVERRHKENVKWIKIGIVAGAVVTIILGTAAIFFNYIFSQ